jgi:hypothetical protein
MTRYKVVSTFTMVVTSEVEAPSRLLARDAARFAASRYADEVEGLSIKERDWTPEIVEAFAFDEDFGDGPAPDAEVIFDGVHNPRVVAWAGEPTGE